MLVLPEVRRHRRVAQSSTQCLVYEQVHALVGCAGSQQDAAVPICLRAPSRTLLRAGFPAPRERWVASTGQRYGEHRSGRTW